MTSLPKAILLLVFLLVMASNILFIDGVKSSS